MAIKFPTIPSKTLATSINAAATSIQLSDIVGWDGVDLTSAGLGSNLWAVFRDSTNTQMELMQLDPTTIANSSITILKRGLGFDGSTTEVTANKLTWVKNDTIVELGSNPPQLFQSLKDYIDSVAIAGAANASTVTQGLVQLATQPQIDAGTATGSTGASLTVAPNQVRAKQYNSYAADASGTGTYAITVSPAPVAYTAGDVYIFKAFGANVGAATLNVNSLGAQTLKNTSGNDLAANDITAGKIVEVVYDGTNFQIVSQGVTSKFGGTGADGALALTSGTTTIDLASAAIVVKNYTSISITGTGKLAFSNPNTNGTVVILKSQGNVTLTSSNAPMIDASAIGAAGGVAVSGTSQNGQNGSNGLGLGSYTTNRATDSGSVSSPGVGGTAPTNTPSTYTIYGVKYPVITAGAGGSSGVIPSGTGSYTSGVGGRGGGGLVIECGGAWNFTTSSGISVGGQNGGNAAIVSGGNTGAGGGGGGGGGAFIAFYTSLTSNSGTITTSAGTGGNSGASSGSINGGGGGGSITGAGGTGSAALNGAKSGGDGGGGFSYVAKNTEFT